jgi:predicted nuclease of predicted toxin-antitoxin system
MADENQLFEKKMIAMLIDGDNAQPSLIKEMLAEASKYGRTTLRKIYGDWTTPQMSGWKQTLQENAIQPVQQFRYTVGKNATDSALIIDAMDILHSGVVDGFCLVSSDSDFTRLATRIREKGVFVMGIGERKTPKSFSNACDLFVFTENLAVSPASAGGKAKASESSPKASPVAEALPVLRKAFDLCVQEDGWANLGALGSSLRKLDPSFDHRTYGCSSLKALITKLSTSIQAHEDKRANGGAVVLIRFK